MGSTLAGLLFSGNVAWAFNLGDSRIYQLHDQKLTQLSVDHVDSRPLSGNRKAKPSLTQHLGISEEEFLVEPSMISCTLVPGDTFLLCSDGLTDMLSDEEISEILVDHSSLSSQVERLIDFALERGGRDNITIILCTVS